MKKEKTIHAERYSRLIDELCAERKRLGLSQDEVANALGLSQSDISKIETRERRLDVFEFSRILHIYRVNENAKLKRLVSEFFGLGIV